MAQIIFDNSRLKREMKAFLKGRFGDFLERFERRLTLNIIQISSNLASEKYANLKVKMGESLGVSTFYYRFEEGENGLVLWKNGKIWENWQEAILKITRKQEDNKPNFGQKNEIGLIKQKQNSANFKTELFKENLKKTKIQQIQNFINYLAYENEDKLPNHHPQKAERKLKNGLILQLPLPSGFENLVETVNWSDFLDVDFLGADNSKLWHQGILPPTIQAIDLVLKSFLANKQEDLTGKIEGEIEGNSSKLEQKQNMVSQNSDQFGKLDGDVRLKNLQEKNGEIENFLNQKLDLTGKIVAIIGQGKLVGTPLLSYFQKTGATIISLNKDTPDKIKLAKLAEIVIAASGVPSLVQSSWLKNDVVLIDAATSESDGFLVGDVDRVELEKSNMSFKLCPSPGGIGPLTVLSIFWNLYQIESKFS